MRTKKINQQSICTIKTGNGILNSPKKITNAFNKFFIEKVKPPLKKTRTKP